MADEENNNPTPEEQPVEEPTNAGDPAPEAPQEDDAPTPDAPEASADPQSAAEEPGPGEPAEPVADAAASAPEPAEASTTPETEAVEPSAPQAAPSNNGDGLSISQEELDAMMGGAGGGATPKPPSQDTPVDDTDPSPAAIDQTELDSMVEELSAGGQSANGDGGDDADIMAEMAAAIAAEKGDAAPASPGVVGGSNNKVDTSEAAEYAVPDFDVSDDATELAAIDMLDDVELNVKIELGRTEMYIEDVLQLGVGSVVELNKLAGDPVDIFVNEQLIARGEVLVLNDNFCVRINEILCPMSDVGVPA
jgi:flagellar motor switch protein FliN/FliY